MKNKTSETREIKEQIELPDILSMGIIVVWLLTWTVVYVLFSWFIYEKLGIVGSVWFLLLTICFLFEKFYRCGC